MASKISEDVPDINILARSMKSMQLESVGNKGSPMSMPPCKCLTYSSDGLYLAVCDAKGVKVLSTKGEMDEVLFEVDKPRVVDFKFSPLSTYIVMWEPASRDPETQQLPNNLFVYDWNNNKLVLECLHKKQTDWQPQWSADEVLFTRQNNTDIHFYQDHDFSAYKHRLHQSKLSSYKLSNTRSSLSPSYHVSIYVPGSKGEPSFVKLYQYPSLTTPVANKSFFKAEACKMNWNPAGTAVLLLTGSETTANSYYGEQHLHFISLKQEGCMVPRAKEGPIYSMDWHPSSKEFCVVYGYMPAKATVYNLKCDVTFDFGTGPRNSVFYSPFGNLLCLAGYGNIRGSLDFWDMEQKKSVSKFECPDTTHFEWLPDGVHLITATLSPRLRVNNCYKVWHYSGVLIKELKIDELYSVTWQPVAKGTFQQPSLELTASQAAVVNSIAAVTAEKSKAYVPPALRKVQGQAGTKIGFSKPASAKFKEAYELPSNVKATTSADDKPVNKTTLKNQKRRDNKRAKKLEEEALKLS